MKKKLLKKGLLLWVACFILSMCFIPFEAKAATDSAPKVEKRIVRYRSTYVNDKQVYLENLENGKITSVKSSNRNVARIESVGRDYFTFENTKLGSSKVTIKVKKNKKIYTLKTTIVIKEARPVQYLKVDGKNVFSVNNKGSVWIYDKKSKHKVSWKLAKGWKLVFAGYSYDATSYAESRDRKMKNGGSIRHRSTGEWVSLRVKDKEGVEYKLNIHFAGKSYS